MLIYTHTSTYEKTKKIDNFEKIKINKRKRAILDSLIRLLLLQQSLSSQSSSFSNLKSPQPVCFVLWKQNNITFLYK